ncbi:MAG: hypothetical protein WCD25_19080 [Pseudolabrys sp.]
MNDDGHEQEQTDYPKQRPKVAEVFRVTIDPVGTDKNLQIAKQMPDHKEDQNDARERDNHFFSNRRAIKSSKDIHDDLAHAEARRTLFEIMNAARSVKAASLRTRFGLSIRLVALVE